MVPTSGRDRVLSPAGFDRPLLFLDNCIASTSIFEIQATKSQRWMPWHMAPMKDVFGCEKPRGVAERALIRGCPNGETHHPSWGGTPV